MVVRKFVFKQQRDEKERSVEAVAAGSTYIIYRSFPTSENTLQYEVNARVLETTSFIFAMTPDIASLRTANSLDNLEATRSSQMLFHGFQVLCDHARSACS